DADPRRAVDRPLDQSADPQASAQGSAAGVSAWRPQFGGKDPPRGASGNTHRAAHAAGTLARQHLTCPGQDLASPWTHSPEDVQSDWIGILSPRPRPPPLSRAAPATGSTRRPCTSRRLVSLILLTPPTVPATFL